MSGENVPDKSSILPFLSPFKAPSSRTPLQDENSVPSYIAVINKGKHAVKQEQQTVERAKQSSQPSLSKLAKSHKGTAKKNYELRGRGAESVDDAAHGHREPGKKATSKVQLTNGSSAKINGKYGPRKNYKRTTNKWVKSPVSQNHKVTDFFPIRRSSRKCIGQLKSENKKIIDELILNGKEEGMEVGQIDGKGRGVKATQDFKRGEFVVEYHGDLIEFTDAKKREAQYAQDPSTGCYMYYFRHLSKTYCVDATKETARLGRLINHSKNGNCQTKLHDIAGRPHLILVALRDIKNGEELLYDYGDRSRASVAAHPWLKR
ncbi:N-lysine methyltransferase KMT5A isoform X2 [Callorhinchus milii]|nr:N-lysine methyltransferase KMT5A isoform X2 [Callorhinchus milii]|eukprot:gi/632978576/ref/XP_007905991.1/ PREDICTED: N-lysine methyltransferase SETD8 isoform X2 [Callorhinchus milii]